MFPAELTELISLQTIRIILLVFHGRVIPLLAERTSHVNDFTHLFLLDTNRPNRSQHALSR